MTTATLPTKISISLSGIKYWCDSTSNIKFLEISHTSANGTNFSAAQVTGSNYTVPGATNCRIFNTGTMVAVITGTTPTLFQIGYADDASGTNFVLLADLSWMMSSLNISAGTKLDGFPIGMITIPTGKLINFKMTSAATTFTVKGYILGLETA